MWDKRKKLYKRERSKREIREGKYQQTRSVHTAQHKHILGGGAHEPADLIDPMDILH